MEGQNHTVVIGDYNMVTTVILVINLNASGKQQRIEINSKSNKQL